MKHRLAIHFALLAGALGSCAAEPEPPRRGELRYEDRQPTADGLSERLYEQPAVFVTLERVDDGGDAFDETATDEDGRFTLASAKGSWFALSRTEDPSPIEVVDSQGELYRVPLRGDGVTLVSATDEAQTAGAFNILGTARKVISQVASLTGKTVPPLTLTWQLGNLGSTALGLPVSSSFYTHEDGEHLIVIAGGIEGQISRSITSHFDDHVVAHEVSHFVQRTQFVDASLGGAHNGNNLYFSLAFSEGFATWLACATLGDPRYISTVGQPPTAQSNFANYSVENIDDIPGRAYGNDSELTVSEVLWDLWDGSAEYPEDEDEDGVGLGLGELLSVFARFDAERDYPYLSSLLVAFEEQGLLNKEQITGLLREPTDQNVPYPPEVEWPFALDAGVVYRRELGVPEEIELDASSLASSVFLNDFWRFDVGGTTEIDLAVDVDPFDLDPPLELRLLSNDNELLASAAGPPYPVSLPVTVAAGRYVVHVQAEDHASYQIELNSEEE